MSTGAGAELTEEVMATPEAEPDLQGAGEGGDPASDAEEAGIWNSITGVFTR